MYLIRTITNIQIKAKNSCNQNLFGTKYELIQIFKSTREAHIANLINTLLFRR
jgi:hypothetical protein